MPPTPVPTLDAPRTGPLSVLRVLVGLPLLAAPAASARPVAVPAATLTEVTGFGEREHRPPDSPHRRQRARHRVLARRHPRTVS
ncbi:hypothetical protein AB5J52_43430 [Streptomyces sp. R39]|uniref:Uncharacterized protein n=1 Tax=Streptomyces sp. R39 TaxID=3238631 RepID=A0AB39QY44_9ACTN